MGPYLPGDLTPFSELKRIVPNIDFCYKDGAVRHTRFYPRKEMTQCANSREYDAVIKKAADILKNNMELIARKWERPQISLTGGIDSNTTFARQMEITISTKPSAIFLRKRKYRTWRRQKRLQSVLA